MYIWLHVFNICVYIFYSYIIVHIQFYNFVIKEKKPSKIIYKPRMSPLYNAINFVESLIYSHNLIGLSK